MDNISQFLLMGGESGPAQGQIVYEGVDSAGVNQSTTYSFVVPSGVTSICVVCVGAGAGGGYGLNGSGNLNSGGGGGATAYANNIAVTPGETLEVLAGRPGREGQPSINAGTGGLSCVRRGAANAFAQAGGGVANTGYTAPGGTVAFGTGGAGGAGGVGQGTQNPAGGGGGAGGYSGTGGAGGGDTSNPSAGAGGGGGGAGKPGVYSQYNGDVFQTWRNGGAGGGGVGLLGQGSNGAAGTTSSPYNLSTVGGGGSGGMTGPPANGTNGERGGAYGGGAGGGGTYIEEDPVTGSYYGYGFGATGSRGAVRIIWGAGRAFPSTNTGDV